MFNQIGLTEILVIILVLIIIFGGGKITTLAKGLGEAIRETKNIKDELVSPKNKK